MPTVDENIELAELVLNRALAELKSEFERSQIAKGVDPADIDAAWKHALADSSCFRNASLNGLKSLFEGVSPVVN